VVDAPQLCADAHVISRGRGVTVQALSEQHLHLTLEAGKAVCTCSMNVPTLNRACKEESYWAIETWIKER
jgi:hypothetical protein